MIAGRYQLDREIGRGGMGAVWLARDTTLGREVAIKRLGLMPGVSGPDLDRAAREARLAARLNHPHVVHVFDLVNEDEGQWLVMEYVEGRTLAAMVRVDGPLSLQRASALLGQAADALAAAHAAGIVHRDVKPSNILVGHDDEVKLSDFGIARAEADASLTQTGLVTGSPAYLSPEVASGHTATSASDVWSLGATLYHALSGRPPYEVGENLMGALFRIVHEDPPRLADAGWLAPLLEATMTKQPDARWSMAEVRDYLHSGGRGGAAATSSGATQVMTAAPAAEASPPAPAAETPPPAQPPPPAAGSDSRRRRRWLPLVLAAAVLLVLGALAWTLLRGDDGSSPTIDRPDASEKAGGGASDSSSPAPEGPTARGMERFIDNYLATAPSSPETTFEMLTPAFQRASGGLEGYSGYWSTIATAEPVEVSADPDSLVVEYTVAYTRQDGSEATDDVVLQLQFEDGQYLIADET
ncbi:serine/threonine-protein kinase [Nocardioides sp. GXQ0305]|uniref:serine/threonine-protein kinase n=1 Tax=Nocardioides sp. GXQ0305 TaxID=3423912 RepID=UPI003D7D4122